MTPRADRHAPTRFKTYRQAHETVMNQFLGRGFVKSTTLEFRSSLGGIMLQGEVSCLGNIVLTVEKFLKVSGGSCRRGDLCDDALVQTLWYSYNASVRNQGNILRYDNQDGDYLRPGHCDAHHKHSFDWRSGEEYVGSPVWIGYDNWKTLGEVLEELENWYWQNRDDLPDPDIYSVLGLRQSPPSLEL